MVSRLNNKTSPFKNGVPTTTRNLIPGRARVTSPATSQNTVNRPRNAQNAQPTSTGRPNTSTAPVGGQQITTPPQAPPGPGQAQAAPGQFDPVGNLQNAPAAPTAPQANRFRGEGGPSTREGRFDARDRTRQFTEGSLFHSFNTPGRNRANLQTPPGFEPIDAGTAVEGRINPNLTNPAIMRALEKFGSGRVQNFGSDTADQIAAGADLGAIGLDPNAFARDLAVDGTSPLDDAVPQAETDAERVTRERRERAQQGDGVIGGTGGQFGSSSSGLTATSSTGGTKNEGDERFAEDEQLFNDRRTTLEEQSEFRVDENGDIWLDPPVDIPGGPGPRHKGNIRDPDSWDERVAEYLQGDRGPGSSGDVKDRVLGNDPDPFQSELYDALAGSEDVRVNTDGSIDYKNKDGDWTSGGNIFDDPSTWDPFVANKVKGVNKPTEEGIDLEQMIKDLLGEAPEGVDVDELLQSQREARAVEQSRTLQSMASSAARGGLAPEASIGGQAGIQQEFASQGAQQDAQLKLQGEVQNMQQQMEFFRTRAEALFRQASMENDANTRQQMFAQASALQRQSEQFQREMFELQNQVTAGDVFGGILGGVVSPFLGGFGTSLGKKLF